MVANLSEKEFSCLPWFRSSSASSFFVCTATQRTTYSGNGCAVCTVQCAPSIDDVHFVTFYALHISFVTVICLFSAQFSAPPALILLYNFGLKRSIFLFDFFYYWNTVVSVLFFFLCFCSVSVNTLGVLFELSVFIWLTRICCQCAAVYVTEVLKHNFSLFAIHVVYCFSSCSFERFWDFSFLNKYFPTLRIKCQ